MLSDWSDCETKRVEINHEAKMAISRVVEDDEGMADQCRPDGRMASNGVFFDVLDSHEYAQTELVQLLQGKTDCATFSNPAVGA